MRFLLAVQAIITAITMILPMMISSSFASAFVFGPVRQQLKSELLALATETQRGLTATPQQQAKILQLFERLEKLNPTNGPLKSPKVNGSWDLQYTTSDSILGRGGFSRVGPIEQHIDTTTLSAYNSEVVKFGLVRVPRKVTATLEPQSNRLTKVQFKTFQIGPLAFQAPESFKGSLDITYLDDELRLTRGDKGNIFVLTKMK